MNKPNVSKMMKTVTQWTTKHSPEILTGVGIASGITTVVLAVKATPKAIKLIEEEKKDLKTDKLSPIETVKAAWKPYIPAVLTGAASVACIVSANSVNARRNAALAAAYQISTTALSEYKEKVIETIGEKKERTVREKVAQSRVEKKPASTTEVIVTKKGDTMFFDPLSGRYFKSDIEKIKSIVNDLNRRMIGGEQYMSLSEFYLEIGLQPTLVSDKIGWRIDKAQIEIDYPAVKAEDETPCLSLDYLTVPEYGFDQLY